jgi:hypothetical protein
MIFTVSEGQKMIAGMFFSTTIMAAGCLEITAGYRLIGMLCFAASVVGWLGLYFQAR